MESTTTALIAFIDFLRQNPAEGELFYRTPFQNLLEATKPTNINVDIHQEPRKADVEVDGVPDFFVYNDITDLFSSLIGFIECKKPSISIDHLTQSDQIKKYAKTTANIILTNYRRFILLQGGKITHDITLADATKSAQDFENMLRDFYAYKYPYIKTKNTLVKALAAQSAYCAKALQRFMRNDSNQNENFYTKFKGLYQTFQVDVKYEYDKDDFCDVYSQSFVYGLLLSKLETHEETLNEKKLLEDIPNEYMLLYNFLSVPLNIKQDLIPADKKYAITNIIKNINHIDADAIEAESAL
jgi:hypothetical protein